MKLHLIKNLSLLVTSLLFIALLSEFSLRFFCEPIQSGWGWNDSPRRHLSTFENDSTNCFGLRGQKISYTDDDFVILLVGDSQVEAATSSPLDMPERLLENFLNQNLEYNIKVFSLAASGWGQDQQLLTLKKYYKDYRADLVIIWSTPKNDFWENTFPDRSLTTKAGHIKPTYMLDGNNILGPLFTPDTYYQNSVLLQLFYSAIQNINDETLEQRILSEWIKKLPEPHNSLDYTSNFHSNSAKEIDINTFSQNLEHYSNEDSLTIIINEDFLNSRSHFSPFAVNRSLRDNYLINITQKLYEQIISLTEVNESHLLVLYPRREDYDQIYTRTIKNIKLRSLPEVIIPVNLDYLSLMQTVVPKENLISFAVQDGKEISFSNKDRHLSHLGNKIIMGKLAEVIIEYIK